MKRFLVHLGIPFLATGIALWMLFAWLSLPANAQAQNALTQPVTVVGNWGGIEQDSFSAVLAKFTTLTGISATYTSSADLSIPLLDCFTSDTCPDVALIPNPGQMSELFQQGALVPLDPIVPNFDLYYTTTWRTLSSVGGQLYGVPFKAASKSIIWYRPQALDAISATTPQTWTALLTLCDDLVANGQTPFAIGAESGGATGWPLSDWFENTLLRVGGPEVHRRLARHAISWTDPTVVAAMQRFGDIVGQNDYQAGGITGTLNNNFINAIDLVFGSPPSATMTFEGSWVQGIISGHFPALAPVIDYNFYDFPQIDPAFDKPLMGGADFAILFHNTPEAQALIQFLATPQAAEVWAARGEGFLSPNRGVDLNVYPDELSRSQAQELMGAKDFVFDLDDQLPSALQVYVWNALVGFVAHPDQLTSLLQGIEAKATELQGPPYKIYLPAALRK